MGELVVRGATCRWRPVMSPRWADATDVVRLDEETEALIRRLAESAGRTRSWVVREAVAEYAAQRQAPLRAPYEAFAPFLGIIESGHGTLSENTVTLYAELVTKKQRGRRSR